MGTEAIGHCKNCGLTPQALKLPTHSIDMSWVEAMKHVTMQLLPSVFFQTHFQ